jgi:hypothetical protein
MGENPLISDGKRHPSPLMENANNLSKNFDASVKKIRPPPSTTGWETDAILKDSVPEDTEDRELQYRTKEVRRRNKEKKNQNEKGPEEMAYFCFNRWILLLFYPVSSAC